MSTSRSIVLTLISLPLFAACSSTPRLSESPELDVDLSGRWVLDREASDNPEEMIQTAMAIAQIEGAGSSRRKSGGKGGGMRDGGKPGGSSGGRRGGDGTGGDDRSDMSSSVGRGGMGMTDPGGTVPNPGWIDIEQSEDLVRVDYGGQRFRRYPLDTPITEVSFAGQTETKSGWSGTDFWTVTKSERGLTLTEHYVVSPDGSELVLETVLDSKTFDDPLTIRRVFHPES